MRSSPDYRSKKLRLIASITNALGSFAFFWVQLPRNEKLTIRRLLILKFDRIGDTFLATPAIRAIREILPDAEITFFAAPWNVDVLSGNPHIDNLRVCADALDVHNAVLVESLNPRRIRKLATEIRNFSPDAVIDLQGNPLNVMACFAAGVPLRIGFKRKLMSFLLNRPVTYKDDLHVSQMYLSIARDLGYMGERPPFELRVSEGAKEKAIRILRESGLGEFVVFHLGSGRSYRQWPWQHFVSLAERILASNPGMKVVMIGDKGDAILTEHLQSRLDSGIVNLAGTLRLHETYALLARAKGFVGNESGPAHLAASVGIPTIMMMNEWSGIERWQALGDKVHVVRSKPIHACTGINCTIVPCPNMAAITVDEVFQIASRFCTPSLAEPRSQKDAD